MNTTTAPASAVDPRQFKSFAEIVESFFLGLSLTRYIDVKALRNEPLPLLPNGR